MEIRQKIINIICKILEISEDEIDFSVPFTENEELAFDSIAGLDILTSLEKEFKIRISEDSLKRMDTLDNIVILVNELLNR